MNSRAQIVATIGGPSNNPDIFYSMVLSGVDVVRLNFSWGDLEEKKVQLEMIRNIEAKIDKKIPKIVDLPGPRVQSEGSHTYDKTVEFSLTEDISQCREVVVG